MAQLLPPDLGFHTSSVGRKPEMRAEVPNMGVHGMVEMAALGKQAGPHGDELCRRMGSLEVV